MSPTAAKLDAITPEALVEFHRTHYVPDHATIAFAETSRSPTRESSWKRGSANGKRPARQSRTSLNPTASGAPKVYLIARPGSVQTTLYVGTQSMTRTDPDYAALTVVNRVLGGTMGRLFRHLREEKGYTYGVGSGFSATHYRGSWTSSTSVRTDVTEPALTDLLAEIAELRDKPIPENELADAKRAIVGSFALSAREPAAGARATTSTTGCRTAGGLLGHVPGADHGGDSGRGAGRGRKYWAPARLQIVAVGDATKVTDMLGRRAAGGLRRGGQSR